ncbi:AraC family transcriptional regulator [Chondromyces crocatus]|nr:AraC family transcriptional regulator [Chondromyces crocatus]
MKGIEELRTLAHRLSGQPGETPTALQGVTLLRLDAPLPPSPVLYTPRLCIGIDGRKEIANGEKVYEYGPGDELVVSVAVPVTGRILTVPYLAFAMEFHLVEIAQMHLELPPPEEASTAVLTGPASPELLDAVVRALRMLEHPDEVALLGPLVRREILFRVLSGPRGSMLRTLALDQGNVARIARAVAFLREHYAEPISIEHLARDAAMSVTSFHRHFKAVTAMSPLQYQKQLRLQEARHLLLGEALDVGTVSTRVGYESTTHFTREYARLFGAPPRRDAERLRARITEA